MFNIIAVNRNIKNNCGIISLKKNKLISASITRKTKKVINIFIRKYDYKYIKRKIIFNININKRKYKVTQKQINENYNGEVLNINFLELREKNNKIKVKIKFITAKKVKIRKICYKKYIDIICCDNRKIIKKVFVYINKNQTKKIRVSNLKIPKEFKFPKYIREENNLICKVI
ncbi:hypothetical protein [Candidatus Vidania fulgoroideorum]